MELFRLDYSACPRMVDLVYRLRSGRLFHRARFRVNAYDFGVAEAFSVFRCCVLPPRFHSHHRSLYFFDVCFLGLHSARSVVSAVIIVLVHEFRFVVTFQIVLRLIFDPNGSRALAFGRSCAVNQNDVFVVNVMSCEFLAWMSLSMFL